MVAGNSLEYNMYPGFLTWYYYQASRGFVQLSPSWSAPYLINRF